MLKWMRYNFRALLIIKVTHCISLSSCMLGLIAVLKMTSAKVIKSIKCKSAIYCTLKTPPKFL